LSFALAELEYALSCRFIPSRKNASILLAGAKAISILPGVFFLVKREGRWLIASGQNTEIRPEGRDPSKK
jgi:hypothetical protein